MRLAGIDLAWNGERNPSAIAIGCLEGNVLSIEEIKPSLIGLSEIRDFLLLFDNLSGIAIDASLIINNQDGYRDCEIELSNVYRSKWASCHPTNLSLYPDAFSVKLYHLLREEGFEYFKSQKWLVECYPHASIIEIFNLKKRLLYKKGKVAERREGQKCFANYLSQLCRSSIIQLSIPEYLNDLLKPEYIDTLKGKALKTNEDALDAIVCLYTAALYASKKRGVMFGNQKEGAVWVPQVKCIPD